MQTVRLVTNLRGQVQLVEISAAYQRNVHPPYVMLLWSPVRLDARGACNQSEVAIADVYVDV